MSDALPMRVLHTRAPYCIVTVTTAAQGSYLHLLVKYFTLKGCHSATQTLEFIKVRWGKTEHPPRNTKIFLGEVTVLETAQQLPGSA